MYHRLQIENRKAFTLVEVLVVIAVIAVFLGVLGLALSGGSGTRGTEAGQRIMATMVSAARSQAVSNQATVRLIIHADPPTAGDMGDPRREKFLRFVAILVSDGVGGWREINDGVYLPRGIYVVPPWTLDAPAPVIGSDIISSSSSDWKHERRTILAPKTMQYLYGDPTLVGTGDHYLYLEFSPKGTVVPTTEIGGQDYERRIVLAPAKLMGSYPNFESKADLDSKGGMIRRNGSFTLVNQSEAFPEPN